MSKDFFTSCEICPRRCGANRRAGETGACRVGADPVLARAGLHAWEEPCLSGTRGSGTVFFSGCSLGCVYCQNARIAGGEVGHPVSPSRLADIFLELEAAGAHNVNLVTPTHFAPLLSEVIPLARSRGLTLPIVYNSGGYERVETLRALAGLIDVYLPDFKYADAALAARYSSAPDYPEVARAALAEMIAQQPTPVLDGDGLLQRGVIVRHLLLPGAYRNSHDVVKYLATLRHAVYISLMSQYTPMAGVSSRFPELSERVRDKDYRRLVAYAVRLGIERAYVQEGGAAEESFIPAFDLTGVLPKE
ncbi:MAG: radical SAM protein [Clostridia bacterium]|nr:radical SAM protein [Clostridia bacterium]